MKHRHSQMPLPPAEAGQISEELELREEQEGPGEEAFREDPPPRRRHIPLSHRTSLKVLAFVLCVLSILTAALSAFGAVMIAEEDLYTIPQETYLEDVLQNLATGDSYQLARALLRGEEDPASFLLRGNNIRSVSVRFPEGGPMADWIWGDPAGGGVETFWYWSEIDSSLHLDREDAVRASQALLEARAKAENLIQPEAGTQPEAGAQPETDSLPPAGETGDEEPSSPAGTAPEEIQIVPVAVTLELKSPLTDPDAYLLASKLIPLAYTMRYWIYAVILGSAVLAVGCLVFLVRASGRRRGLAEPQMGWGTRFPLDLLTVAVGLGIFLMVQFVVEFTWYSCDSPVLELALYALTAIVAVSAALGWLMSVSLRFKLGIWWRNTLLWQALRLMWFLGKKLWKYLRIAGRKVLAGMKALGRGVGSLMRNVPLVWRSVLAAAVYLALCGVAYLISAMAWSPGPLLVFWIIQLLVLLPGSVLLGMMCRRLRQGAESLAAGDLSSQVDTRRMLPELRRHGEDLNRIGEGMTAAVEQRLKSERMKTELITNVSHDIKTPLTSIINYADLIGKEPCDNPTVTQYAQVLHRQSERLKRLIDDLVEASKASTGNLEVLLAPCEVGVLLSQTAGEYEQRLVEKGLQLVTGQPERPVKILADGRRLWRVFDNLMNNICKYALSGTRVYLTLEEQDGQAVISFKNTSREALNLTEAELMERFVRGDSARTSEGNGLGLSIARSLTELQKGKLDLTVDGDLFKVVLRFPLLGPGV
nr:HAMP domain-containing sensor histidine kinase [uncultured Dysosmobacter sp.]